MKKLILLPLIVIIAAGLVFSSCGEPEPAPAPAPAPTPAPTPAPSPAPPKEPIVLKFVSFKPDVPPANVHEHLLIDKVKEKTNGAVIIEWVGGPEAIPPTDAPSAVQSGAMDMVSALYGNIDTVIPGWECLGFKTITDQEFRESPAWDIASDLCQEKGTYLLGASTPCRPNTMAAFYSKTKIAKIDDFKGIKFATQGPAYAALLDRLGAIPAIIPMPDYFTAMERGTVDAFHVGVPGIIDWGCLDVTNYMITKPFTGSNSSAFLVNLDVWNSIPKDLQDAINAAAVETEIDGAVAWDNIIESVENEAVAHGVELVEFSPDETQKFFDILLDTTWGFVMGKNPDLVAKFKELVVK
jgi:TRAP-type C4-dicarboxylate transport system substrate-binding protein